MPSKPAYFHDLDRNVEVLSVQLANLRESFQKEQQAGEAARAEIASLRHEVAELRREQALTKQAFDDHLKQGEAWIGRRWALAVAIGTATLGGLLGLVSGLIVSLARK